MDGDRLTGESHPERPSRIPEGTLVHHDGPLLPTEEQQLMEGLLAGDDAAIRQLLSAAVGPPFAGGA